MIESQPRPQLHLFKSDEGEWQAVLEPTPIDLLGSTILLFPEEDDYLHAYIAASVCCDVATVSQERHFRNFGLRFMFRNTLHGEIVLSKSVHKSDLDTLIMELLRKLRTCSIEMRVSDTGPRHPIFRAPAPQLLTKEITI